VLRTAHRLGVLPAEPGAAAGSSRRCCRTPRSGSAGQQSGSGRDRMRAARRAGGDAGRPRGRAPGRRRRRPREHRAHHRAQGTAARWQTTPRHCRLSPVGPAAGPIRLLPCRPIGRTAKRRAAGRLAIGRRRQWPAELPLVLLPGLGAGPAEAAPGACVARDRDRRAGTFGTPLPRQPCERRGSRPCPGVSAYGSARFIVTGLLNGVGCEHCRFRTLTRNVLPECGEPTTTRAGAGTVPSHRAP
jgi:hypothetical protein